MGLLQKKQPCAGPQLDCHVDSARASLQEFGFQIKDVVGTQMQEAAVERPGLHHHLRASPSSHANQGHLVLICPHF